MKSSVLKSIDYMIARSNSKAGLFALEKVFRIGIPFNKPHGINFLKLSENESRMKMKNKRLNHNHLGGIHACAIATLGEFTAGILLCKNFQMTKYRVIMKDIYVEFKKQARSSIESESNLTEKEIESILKQIALEDKASIELKTIIKDINNEEVAVVTTNWQMKDWSKTQLK